MDRKESLKLTPPDGQEILRRTPPEMLLRFAKKDLAAAKEAQQKGENLPPFRTIALLLTEGALDRVPLEIWEELGEILMQLHKCKQGRPSTKDKYLAIAEEEYRLKTSGMKYTEKLDFLAESFGYKSHRSTLAAIKKGKELLDEKREEEFAYLRSLGGLSGLSGMLYDPSYDMSLTDEKD